MTNYRTGRFSKIVMLLVGVCLIGTVFHVHQLHPAYSLQDSNSPHHLEVDQPDCVACMNMMQALPAIKNGGVTIRHETALVSLSMDRIPPEDYVSDLKNKSPPCRIPVPAASQPFS